MRTSNGDLIQADDGSLLGVYFGYGRCGEHERGIAPLQRAFGIPNEASKDIGVVRRQMTRVPDNLLCHKMRGGGSVFACLQSWGDHLARLDDVARFPWKDRVPALKKDGTPAKRKQIDVYETKAFAWDESEFAVRLVDHTAIEALDAAARRCDLVLWLGGPDAKNPFGRAGLCMAIASRLPATAIQEWETFDLAKQEMDALVAASNIEVDLQIAGKRYYALHPQRFASGLRISGALRGLKGEDVLFQVVGSGDVAFFLNPMNERGETARSGWYSLDELRAWARNEGPVCAPQTSGDVL